MHPGEHMRLYCNTMQEAVLYTLCQTNDPAKTAQRHHALLALLFALLLLLLLLALKPVPDTV
jgi:hypothetical protein